ncbi:MAG TPA: hypothetical protein VEP90_00215 [Methylomirabilota bacterium]|nr:hypothetical protein [Methylomirabilota bacterium]
MPKHAQRTKSIYYHVIVPLKFAYRSKHDGTVVKTFSRTLDLPIMDTHLKDIEKIIEETHVSHEQALFCLIQAIVDENLENRRKGLLKDVEPQAKAYDLTITIGMLRYNKQLITYSSGRPSL